VGKYTRNETAEVSGAFLFLGRADERWHHLLVSDIERSDAIAALDGAYRRLIDLVSNLDDENFRQPTRCESWSVTELLFHILGDAQRALIAFATPEEGVPDVDFVTYWKPFKPGSDLALAHARFIRVGGSAYAAPSGLVKHWTDTAKAAIRAARDCSHPRVGTQGHILELPDFLSTLAAEATIHHLDLTLKLDDPAGPDPTALSLTRRTLEGLLESGKPERWDDATFVLKGAGRVPLTDEDRESLGPAAERFPLLG
jgi:uncharacterized protein (TIGR03083 family)